MSKLIIIVNYDETMSAVSQVSAVSALCMNFDISRWPNEFRPSTLALKGEFRFFSHLFISFVFFLIFLFSLLLGLRFGHTNDARAVEGEFHFFFVFFYFF